MPNLKEIRTRISSIRSTRQITSAMKMVAASKLHKSQQAIGMLRQYENNLQRMLNHAAEYHRGDYSHPLLGGKREIKTVLVIPISSNKGLCGTHNVMLHKKTALHLRSLQEGNLETQLYPIGKKAIQFYALQGRQIIGENTSLIESYKKQEVENFLSKLVSLYLNKEIDRIDVVYYRFRNAVIQNLCTESLLPLKLWENYPGEIPFYEDGGFILEPDVKQVLDHLVPVYLNFQFYRILLDAIASENGARMTAMHQATDNADELLHSLNLSYNKTRQAMITREITEIVGGAEVFQR